MKKLLSILAGVILALTSVLAQSSSSPFLLGGGGGGSTSYIPPTGGGGAGTNTVGAVTATTLGGIPVITSVANGTNIQQRGFASGNSVLALTSNGTTITYTYTGTATHNESGATNLQASALVGANTTPYGVLPVGTVTNTSVVGQDTFRIVPSFANGILTLTYTNPVVSVTATNNLSVDRSTAQIFNVTLTNNPTLQQSANSYAGAVTEYRFKATNLTNSISLGGSILSGTNSSWSFPLSIPTNTYVNVLTQRSGTYSQILSVSSFYTNGF